MELRLFDGNWDTIDFLDLLMMDIYGKIRHVTIPKEYVNDELLTRGIGFDASNFGFADVSKSDMLAHPDMRTAFVEVKEEHTILHALCDVNLMNESAFNQYPRMVARKSMEYLQEKGIADNAKMLLELEFHLFDDVKYTADFSHSYYKIQSAEGIGDDYDDLPRFNIHRGYHRIYPQDRYFTVRNDIVKAMTAIGIPVKYHHHEVGAAQLEIELNFMDMLEAADKVSIAMWIVHNIAHEHNIFVTFMPKPIYKVAGNGLHVHQYLEKEGKTLFSGDALHGLSPLAHNYTCGLLDHSLTGSLLAFSNPSTNSFKRLVEGYEAPVSATFAKASREASVRIPGYLKKGEERIEFRTGDATANIYYFLSAMLLAGIDGILSKSDPVKKGYNNPDNGFLFPLNLNAVLNGLEKDYEYLLPAFPKELIDLWIKVKRDEAAYVYNAPTPQEYELYFNT
ncbi:glutamine synthetase beta-grasp domain-containing protein [bacterium]|nr:glutamine synthetase beta-grasp domain-containing protein [bacterium]